MGSGYEGLAVCVMLNNLDFTLQVVKSLKISEEELIGSHLYLEKDDTVKKFPREQLRDRLPDSLRYYTRP